MSHTHTHILPAHIAHTHTHTHMLSPAHTHSHTHIHTYTRLSHTHVTHTHTHTHTHKYVEKMNYKSLIEMIIHPLSFCLRAGLLPGKKRSLHVFVSISLNLYLKSMNVYLCCYKHSNYLNCWCWWD